MNLTLFKSAHFLFAGLVSVAFAAWLLVIGASAGSREGSDVTYLLWSGWVAFALMVVAMLYCARKYMHKLRYSPELKSRVSRATLERTDSRLNEIRRKIALGYLTTRGEIEGMARRVVAEEGASRVVRVEVREVEDAGPRQPAFELLALPPEPFGRMSKWLHAHIYYGLASGVLTWLHGGGSLESPLGLAMNVLTLVVIVTGVIGWFLFALGPTWLTRHETDLNFEENFVLEASLGEKIGELMTKFDEEPKLKSRLKKLSRGASDAKLAKALAVAKAESPDAAALLQDVMVLIGQRSRMRRGLGRLSRIRFWMNVWRAVHIPASLLLLGAIVVHILSVWWY